MLSDDSSVDSDSGIRFKTDTTRNKDDSSRRSPSSDRRRFGSRRVRSRSRDRLNRGQELARRRRVSPRSDWRRDRRISPRRPASRLESRISPRRNRRDSPRRKEDSPRRDRRRSLDKENHRSPKRDRKVSTSRERSNLRKNDGRDSNTRGIRGRSRTSVNRTSLEKTDKNSQRSGTRHSSDEKKVVQCSSSISGKNDLPNVKTKVVDVLKRNRDRSSSADLSRKPKRLSNDKAPEKHHRKPSPISFVTKEIDEKKSNESHNSKVKLIRRKTDEAKDETSKDLREKLKIRSGTATPISTPPKMKEKPEKKKSEEPYSAEESDVDSQPTSYYNMITIDEVKSTSLTETINLSDSSEDETVLRDKLQRLEKELKKTKEKKKSKHKDKKHKKSKKEKKDISGDEEPQKLEEFVSSTTDIPPLEHYDLSKSPSEEISSTALKKSEESSEEGEIVSDRDDQSPIDPSDLRYVISQKTALISPDSSHKVSDSPDSAGIKVLNSQDTLVSGPALPPHLKKKYKETEFDCKVEGPALPPHLKTQSGDKESTMGPTIPTNMREKLAQSTLLDPEASLDSNPSSSEASDSDAIGPLPADAKHRWTKAHESLEERALQMKIGSLEGGSNGGDEVKVREEWMLELPEAKALQLGLGPRQFRKREAPDLSDRSSWTDTPKDKALKAAGVVPEKEVTNNELLKQEAQKKYVEERDKEQAKAVKKHKKKHSREESLLEQHEKKLKKKKKKEEKEAGGKVRRPFDRNIDLGVDRFDDAQKKSIIKKAQLLDTRFAGGDSKFL